MAYLDPNQQLAMASGQLQQQVQQPFAMPGAYNAPSYATQSERTATALTQGVTNVAMPGAALATSIGVGMVAPFAAPFRAGMSVGTLGRGFAGAGLLGRTAGTLLGGTAAGLSGIAVPMLAAQGISNAATRMVEGQREFLATRQLMRELPNVGSMFGSQSVLSPGGFGPSAISSSPYQIQSLQNSLSSIGSVYGASSGQMRNIVSQLAPMGSIDTSSIGAISRSLRQSMRELTSIAKMVGSDLDEATQVYSQLKQMGFGSMSSRTQALRQLTGSSALTGMSLGDVTGLASGVVAAATSAGMGTSAGLNIATNALASASVRQQAGAINPVYLQQVGGIQGYAARMAEIQLGMMGSEGAAAAMSNMFDASGNMRAGGFSDALSGRRARRSFFREYDPYRMGAMQQQFSRSSRALILGRVAGIQNEYSGAEANRRQYEFLSGFGITDPTEQLEYLSMLRSQPRAQAMQTAQVLRNQMTTSAGGAGLSSTIGITDRLREGLNNLTQSVFGTGEALERFGATLQQQSEAFVNRLNTAVMGAAPTSARTGMYTQEAMNLTLQRIASGETTFGYADPAQRMRHRLLTDQNYRQALGQSAAISGGAGPSFGGIGRGINQMLYAAGAPILSGSARSLYQQFGGSVGASAAPGAGVFVGTNDAGERMYATADEFMRMRAMSFGADFDPTTGSIVTANQSAVDEILFTGGQRIREFGNILTYGREREISSRRGGTTRIGGFAGGGMFGRGRREMARLAREGGTYQLTQGEIESVRQNRDTYIAEYGRRLGLNPANPRERANLVEAMRQSGDAIAMAAAGESSGVTPSQMFAADTEEAARQQFGAALESLRSGVAGRVSVDDAVTNLINRGRFDEANQVRAFAERHSASFFNAADISQALFDDAGESDPGRARRRRRNANELAADIIGDSNAGDMMGAFVQSLNAQADAGDALGAAGTAFGLTAGAGDRGFGELRRFIETGEGGFGQLSGSALDQALRAYVSTAGSGSATNILGRLDDLLGDADPNSAQGRRINTIRRAVIAGSGEDRSLIRPESSVLGAETIGLLSSLSPSMQQTTMNALTQAIEELNFAAEAGGQSVIESRAQEAMQQVAQNLLQSDDVTQALQLDTRGFNVGGRRVSVADFGELSPEEVQELLASSDFRGRLEEVRERGRPGERAAAERALALLDPTVGGTGSSAGQLQGLIERALTGGITDAELAQLSGITTQGNLAQLQAAMGREGTAQNLFDALGGRDTALAVLKRLDVDTNRDDVVDDTEVGAFLRQIQTDGLSGNQIKELSAVLGAASLLGEDVRQQKEEESFRQLQTRVFEALEASFVSAGEGRALAVVPRQAPAAAEANPAQDNPGVVLPFVGP